jgi:hypothetical protein
LAATHGLGLLDARVAVLKGVLALHKALAGEGALAEAKAAAETAVGMARDRGQLLHEALAWRLVGQCANACSDAAEAEAQLRAALAIQVDLGAALEAARTRLALAHTLLAGTGNGSIPDEAQVLVAEAQTRFLGSGCAGDLAQAQWLLSTWAVADACQGAVPLAAQAQPRRTI